jgi:hypothetical protein
MEIFLLWLAFSFMAAYVAANKGRSGFGFFMLSLVLSPLIGFIAALIAKPIIPTPPIKFKPSEPIDSSSSKSSNLADSSAEKLKALNKLKEDGLITEEEFEQKRAKLIDKMF